MKIETRIQKRKKYFSLKTIIISATVVLCAIFIFSPLQIYFKNQVELNNLQAQIAASEQTKTALGEQLERWNDKNYVIAKARERLGFVFPGEVQVSVIDDSAKDSSKQKEEKKQIANNDPWYTQIGNSFVLTQSLP
ncbi:MAG: septum formation initiator family protein [Bifidobacteriaceae bacterium]|nr:septum formation initiator family protein [Bifidobacteriaceae bacterium]